MKDVLNKPVIRFLALLALLSFPPCKALGDSLNDAEAAGLAALAQRDFQKAYASFQQALLEARKMQDKTRIADQLFYLGLSLQRSIAPNEGVQSEKLAQAIGHYEGALRLRTNSAATLNNLAQLYVLQGNNSLAVAALKKAIALPDVRQSAYTMNYADLLFTSGEWREACRFYALAAWAQPDNEAVHNKLRDVCLKFDPVLLLTYLWDMVEHGQVLQAQEYALDAVASPRWSGIQKDELLTIVAVSLSKQFYQPRVFSTMQVAASLRKLGEDRAVGAGCTELIRLHDGMRLKPSDYPWWSERIRIDRASPRGVWPGEAFQRLSRSLAERYRKDTANRSVVEKYLLLAATLSSEVPDPEALVQLADLYAGSDRLSQLAEVMRQYEERIFAAKGAVIRSGQTKKVYDFHTALGVIYSHMGQWGNNTKVDSAIFQLEHAFALTKPKATSPGLQPIQLSPRLVTLLADGYWKTESSAKAFQFELDSTQQLLKANEPASANQVLQHLEAHPEVKTLGIREKQELEKFKTTLQIHNQASRERTGETPTKIRLLGEAHSIADADETHPLNQQEVRSLETFVGQVVRVRPTNASSRQFGMLPAAPSGTNVKEVRLDGKVGHVVIEKNGKSVEVPFAIENSPEQRAVKMRYVRP